MLPELAGALTLSWPHFFSFVFVSLAALVVFPVYDLDFHLYFLLFLGRHLFFGTYNFIIILLHFPTYVFESNFIYVM